MASVELCRELFCCMNLIKTEINYGAWDPGSIFGQPSSNHAVTADDGNYSPHHSGESDDEIKNMRQKFSFEAPPILDHDDTLYPEENCYDSFDVESILNREQLLADSDFSEDADSQYDYEGKFVDSFGVESHNEILNQELSIILSEAGVEGEVAHPESPEPVANVDFPLELKKSRSLPTRDSNSNEVNHEFADRSIECASTKIQKVARGYIIRKSMVHNSVPRTEEFGDHIIFHTVQKKDCSQFLEDDYVVDIDSIPRLESQFSPSCYASDIEEEIACLDKLFEAQNDTEEYDIEIDNFDPQSPENLSDSETTEKRVLNGHMRLLEILDDDNSDWDVTSGSKPIISRSKTQQKEIHQNSPQNDTKITQVHSGGEDRNLQRPRNKVNTTRNGNSGISRRHNAALLIQRVFRGHLARKLGAQRKEKLKMRFACPNCGMLEQGGVYCKRCGRKVVGLKKGGRGEKMPRVMVSDVPQVDDAPQNRHCSNEQKILELSSTSRVQNPFFGVKTVRLGHVRKRDNSLPSDISSDAALCVATTSTMSTNSSQGKPLNNDLDEGGYLQHYYRVNPGCKFSPLSHPLEILSVPVASLGNSPGKGSLLPVIEEKRLSRKTSANFESRIKSSTSAPPRIREGKREKIQLPSLERKNENSPSNPNPQSFRGKIKSIKRA